MSRRTAFLLGLFLLAGTGCRQKMAEAPYYRPYDECDFYENASVDKLSSARPLERGVIHRAQYLESDPMVTGLTREEWGLAYAREGKIEDWTKKTEMPAPDKDPKKGIGAPRFDPREDKSPKVYVTEFPFAITEADLKRGQERFTIYCAVCHGPLGNGQGKIFERGYLAPTSFHTHIVGKNEVKLAEPRDIPLGYSRGYGIWGIKIPMRDVPIGYIFEVVTKGFGGMPNYAAQVPPADRWRIIAYVKTLMYSQNASAGDVNAATGGGGKK